MLHSKEKPYSEVCSISLPKDPLILEPRVSIDHYAAFPYERLPPLTLRSEAWPLLLNLSRLFSTSCVQWIQHFFYIPMTYLFCNRTLYLLTPFTHFADPRTTTFGNHQHVLCIYSFFFLLVVLACLLDSTYRVNQKVCVFLTYFI